MDVRQLAIQRILQRQEAEAVRLMPNAYTHLMLGIADYNAGSYSAAVDTLQTAYDLAGREGAVRLMLEAKLFSRQCLWQPAGSAQHGAPLSGGAAAGGGFAG